MTVPARVLHAVPLALAITLVIVCSSGCSVPDQAAHDSQGREPLPPLMPRRTVVPKLRPTGVPPIACGGPSAVDIQMSLRGEPLVGQPITVTAEFVVPHDSAFMYERADPHVDVVASLDALGHYDVVTTQPTGAVSREGGYLQIDWPLTVSAGVTEMLSVVLVPTNATGRVESIPLWVFGASMPEYGSGSQVTLRIGDERLPPAVAADRIPPAGLEDVAPPGCRADEPYGAGRTNLATDPPLIDIEYSVDPPPSEGRTTEVAVSMRLPADSPYLEADADQLVPGAVTMRLARDLSILGAEPPYTFAFDPEQAWQYVHWCDVRLSSLYTTTFRAEVLFPLPESRQGAERVPWLNTNIWTEFEDTERRWRYGGRVYVVAGKGGQAGAVSDEWISSADLDRP